jgi:uncharacterized protein YuzE
MRQGRTTVKLEYFADTDTLYVGFVDRVTVESRDVDGVVIDYDAAGVMVGLEIDGASGKLDLTRIETTSLPMPESA